MWVNRFLYASKTNNREKCLFEKKHVGIYRDEGLSFIKTKGSARIVKKIVKSKFIGIFWSEKLGITVDPISQVTDYLDVKLNLAYHTYETYMKPNNIPIYLHVKSNHPSHIIRNIPKMIEHRISNL